MKIQAKETPFYSRLYNEWLYKFIFLSFDQFLQKKYNLKITINHDHNKIATIQDPWGLEDFIFDSELDYFFTVIQLS